MEIIDDIEPHRRGPYGVQWDTSTPGQYGHLYRSPDHGHQRRERACSSWLWCCRDSDPTAEYQETMNKARALVSAIELTHQRLKEA